MEIDLRNLLLADASLMALIPSAENVRINMIAQGVQGPAVSIWRISGADDMTMQGPDGLFESRIQIDVRGKDVDGFPGSGWSAGLPVAQAIAQRLAGYRGAVGATNFRLITRLSERQSSEKPGSEVFHLFSTDFQVWHRAA
jgi:hypothetical protein